MSATTAIRTEQPLWRLHLTRVGYLVLAAGLFVYKWPQLLHHPMPWDAMTSVVICMLAAMSLLALLGLRYPMRMVPILLFEVTWKLLWLAVVALPEWLGHRMDSATRDLTGEVLWVAVILVTVPWPYVYARYVKAPAERWR